MLRVENVAKFFFLFSNLKCTLPDTGSIGTTTSSKLCLPASGIKPNRKVQNWLVWRFQSIPINFNQFQYIIYNNEYTSNMHKTCRPVRRRTSHLILSFHCLIKKNTEYFSLGKTKKLATLAYLLSKIRTQMWFQYRHYVSYKRNHTFLHPLFITT